MKYQQLLYSRTLMQDYRWIAVPDNLTEADLLVLRDVYRHYDDFKLMPEYTQTGLSPVYCLRFSRATVLVECKETPHRDQFGRPVYCMQGISIADDFMRHFWFALPWLLTAHRDALDVWATLDYRAADAMQMTVMGDVTFDLGTIAEFPANANPFSNAVANANIAFDKTGFDRLVQLLANTHTPPVRFAFGILPGADRSFQIFDVFGVIDVQRDQRQIQPPRRAAPAEATPQNAPSAGATSPQKATTRPSAPTKPDRLDRFDPVKMREQHKQEEQQPERQPQSTSFNPFDLAQRILAVILGSDNTRKK